MRVVHLCKTFSARSETFIYDYVTELERQGVDVHVITHRRVNEQERPFGELSVLPWPGVWNAQRLSYRLLEVLGAREQRTSAWGVLRPRLRRHLERLRPDVVHAHFGPMGVLAAPVARTLDLPLVVTFYGHDISSLPREERWHSAYRRLWKAAAAVTVLSKEMQAQAEVLGCPAAKLHIVHLSRRLEAFGYRPPQRSVRRLVSVGRLVEKKGHFDAIEAVGRAVREGHDLRLRIIGEGPLRKRITACIDRHGLGGCVSLLGELPNARVFEELHAADAFVLCSRTAPDGDREGTPTVLVEAQAVGLPCLSTRHAGIPEMIPEENHWLLAEEGDVEGLAERLCRLAEASPEELCRIAEAGRAKVEADFNLRREVEKLRAVYHELERANRPVRKSDQ